MKPNNLQIRIIQTMIGLMQTWLDSDDIDSPTHFVNIQDFTATAFSYNELNDEELKEIRHALIYCLQTISFIGTGTGHPTCRMSHDELVDLVRDVFRAKNLAKASDCQVTSERKELWRKYKVLESKLQKYVESPATKPL